MSKAKIFLLIIAGMALIVSCGRKNNEEASQEKAVSVTVATVEPRDISLEVVYTGNLEGEKQAKIFASIPEAVVELPKREGSRVKKGEAVIILDKGGVSSRYNQARAVYLDAKDNYDKMQNLYKSGAVSEQAFNSAKTSLDVAQANFESARQQVELTSPITGILTDLSVNVGEYAQPGVPLATVAQTGSMRMVIYVESENIRYLAKGQKAQISIDNSRNGNSGFVGTVREVSKSADPDTRLFRVEISISNSEGILRPGMFARARITTASLNSVLTVPREAVFSTDGIYKVYTVEDSRAVEKSISIGEMTDEYAVINSGLEANEKAIVLGRNLVEDGTLVTIADIENIEADKQPGDSVPESEG
jgi:RND family efflux transporter MFP subunit